MLAMPSLVGRSFSAMEVSLRVGEKRGFWLLSSPQPCAFARLSCGRPFVQLWNARGHSDGMRPLELVRRERVTMLRSGSHVSKHQAPPAFCARTAGVVVGLRGRGRRRVERSSVFSPALRPVSAAADPVPPFSPWTALSQSPAWSIGLRACLRECGEFPRGRIPLPGLSAPFLAPWLFARGVWFVLPACDRSFRSFDARARLRTSSWPRDRHVPRCSICQQGSCRSALSNGHFGSGSLPHALPRLVRAGDDDLRFRDGRGATVPDDVALLETVFTAIVEVAEYGEHALPPAGTQPIDAEHCAVQVEASGGVRSAAVLRRREGQFAQQAS
jgi:hypothetical protein